MADPRIQEIIDLANAITDVAIELNCKSPNLFVSAHIMLLNSLADQAQGKASPEYMATVAHSLRQCADHWEHGKEPDYTHQEEEPN